MPARKLPADQRSPRTRSGDLQLVTSTAPSLNAPAHPTHWHRDTVNEWEQLFDSRLAQYLAPTDLPAVLRLFGMYDDRRRLEATAREHPYVEGSQGQVVLNPAHGAISNLDGRILALEDRIGLSPKARLGLGIQLGEAAKSLDSLNRLMAPAPATPKPAAAPKPVASDPRFADVVDVESL